MTSAPRQLSVLTTVGPTSSVPGAADCLRPDCGSRSLTCLGSPLENEFCPSLLWPLPDDLTG